uniref:Uncharacterized protein n=1 Tax=Anguilla anguilla TaxID=7936 RepID=A0A0E9T8C6_ANGAN
MEGYDKHKLRNGGFFCLFVCFQFLSEKLRCEKLNG